LTFESTGGFTVTPGTIEGSDRRYRIAEPALLGEIAPLAAAEHDCCPFFSFDVTIDGRGIALEVTAPADGQGALASVFGVAA
jgi:MerR family transcriptional regulator, copper efflux regulator